MFAQTVVVLVQLGSVLQAQAAAPAEPVQCWWVPHAVPAFQAVQPLPCTWHVWRPAPPHWVALAVQPLVQHCALPGLPKHAPFVHGDDDAA